MNSVRRGAVGLGIAIVGLLAVQATWAYERRALMPPEATVVVRVSDTAACIAAFKQSPGGKLWKDEAFQAFLGHPELGRLLRGAGETNANFEECAHLALAELKMLKGEAVAAFDFRDKADVGFYFVAQMSKEDYQKSLELDKRLAELSEKKTTFSRSDFQGAEIVLTVSKDAQGKEEKNWQTHAQGMLIHSDRKEWVEKTIARVAGEAPTAAPAGAPSIDCRLDGARLTAWLKDAIDSKKPKAPAAPAGSRKQPSGTQAGGAPAGAGAMGAAPDGATVVEALGLATLKDIRLTATFEPGQTRVKLAIDRGAARNGVWAIVDARPAPLDFTTPYLPADLTSFTVNRVDLGALWKEIPVILGKINPSYPLMFEMFTGQLQQKFGINLGADVLDNLYTPYLEACGFSGTEDRVLVAWQLKNAEALASALKRWMADNSPLRMQLQADAKVEDFRGVALYAVTFGGEGSRRTVGAAVAGGLLYAGDIDLVRGMLRAKMADKPETPDFYQSALYREMLKNKPDKATSYNMIDTATYLKLALNDANIGKLKQARQMMLLQPPESGNKAISALVEAIDFSKMPPAERLASFFGPTFAYGSVDGDRLESLWLIKYPAK